MEKPQIIAIVGKGGVGKTLVTALLAKIISEDYDYKLLLIDADPTHPHLSKMVKLVPSKSIESIRSEVIEKTLRKKEKVSEIATNIDFEVYNAIAENKFFSLLSIGQPEDPGCFCPSNALLKKVIQSISRDFEIILIDCEAGLEQINRKVIENIDYLLIITDISLRSVDTADSIRNSADKFTHYKRCGVIINKFEGDISKIIEKLSSYDLPLLDKIPRDEEIIKMELQGLPIFDVNKGFVSYISMRKITKKLMDLLIHGNNPLNS